MYERREQEDNEVLVEQLYGYMHQSENDAHSSLLEITVLPSRQKKLFFFSFQDNFSDFFPEQVQEDRLWRGFVFAAVGLGALVIATQ